MLVQHSLNRAAITKSRRMAAHLFTFIFLFKIVLASGELTLDDVTKAECPDVNKPYKCLPYGICYGPDSFCNTANGEPQSCFDKEISKDRAKLLKFCRDVAKNISHMPHPSCQYACNTVFSNNTELNDIDSDQNDFWKIAACISVFINVVLLLLIVLYIGRFKIKEVSKRFNCAKFGQKKEIVFTQGQQSKGEDNDETRTRVQDDDMVVDLTRNSQLDSQEAVPLVSDGKIQPNSQTNNQQVHSTTSSTNPPPHDSSSTSLAPSSSSSAYDSEGSYTAGLSTSAAADNQRHNQTGFYANTAIPDTNCNKVVPSGAPYSYVQQ